jgi:hypothetical protein
MHSLSPKLSAHSRVQLPSAVTGQDKEIPMAVTLDPAVAEALEPMVATMADAVPPPVGDVVSRRPVLDAIMSQTAAAQPVPTDVNTTDFHATVDDGADVLLRWYVKEGGSYRTCGPVTTPYQE